MHAPVFALLLGCSNGVSDADTWHLRKARIALDDGDFETARRIAQRDLATPGAPYRERDEWLLAMSWVRDEHAPEAELTRAIATMRRIRAARTPTDVTSAVDLGEALARLAESEAEARLILVPLARRDLIGSAHAYAALARIAVDDSMRAVALRRCETIADGAGFCRTGFVPAAGPRDRANGSVLAAILAAMASAVALGLVAIAARVVRRRRFTDYSSESRDSAIARSG